ncbi:hypothetical protein QYE76_051457 [Lolium multiflorum]|uniref:Uncharacterized protein n=1 Tax=Lolium multiflorum TaxID=4521 RepID=A0AAD8SRX0_LOLMU|nr:hypothetical protein QYE76_051457 [Lolium multiflorum]
MARQNSPRPAAATAAAPEGPSGARDTAAQARVDRARQSRRDHRQSPELTDEDMCGLPCFTRRVRKTRVPSGFKLPDNFKKFDGLQDPEDWLVDYLETVKLTGGTRATAMQSIQVHLSGAARSWIKKLAPGSIDSWESFEDVFVKNFRSTCKKPASLEELRACRQKPDEPMRKYIQRWNIIKNSAENISDERAIDAFVAGVRRGDFVEDLGRTNPKTVSALMEIANKWADGEDAVHNKRHRSPEEDRGRNYQPRRRFPRTYQNYDAPGQISAGFRTNTGGSNRDDYQRSSEQRGDNRDDSRNRQNSGPRFPRPFVSPEEMMNGPCQMHFFLDSNGKRQSGHLQKDCRNFQAMLRLKEDDEVKTAFITPYGVFCYRTMPFGLKNAGATYQRMMQKCLATQIGKNVQVYIDDVVITSKKGATLIEDLKETFDNLDKFCLKLNPTKCSFGVPAGELLGFLVSARGIEANPDKIQAIVTMRKPTKLKEIQQLTGRVAALSRFVARLGEKALPFYALIKQGDKFQWNEEADRAFEDLKRTISTPPILVAPKEREPLLLYIAATPQVVSTVLVVEREEEGKLHGVQRPVYFVSEVLSPSKQRLSNDEADVLANIGSQCLAVPPGVFWEEITERSTKSTKSKKKEKKPSGATKEKQEDEEEDQDLVMVIQIPWMQPYISYILRKEIPDDPVEARRVIRRSKAFTVVKGELYKRSISGVLQRSSTKKIGIMAIGKKVGIHPKQVLNHFFGYGRNLRVNPVNTNSPTFYLLVNLLDNLGKVKFRVADLEHDKSKSGASY